MFRTRSIINHTLLHQVSTSLWLTAHKAQNTLFFSGRNFSPISSLLFRVSITFGCLAGVLIPNFSALKQFLNRTRLQQLIGREKSQFYWHIYHVAARKVLEFVSDFSLCLLEFCFPLGEAVRSEKPNVWMQTKREKIEIFIEKVTEWLEHTKKTFLDDDDDEEEGEKFSSIKKAAEEKKDLSVNKPNKLFLLLALDCAFSSNDLRLIAGSRRNNRQLDE